VGDAAVHALLGAAHPRLEAGSHVLDPITQLDEGLLEPRGVRGEVCALPAEDRALSGADASQLHGKHDHP
jgi:hypothetical protein